jgi:hypothetical protein
VQVEKQLPVLVLSQNVLVEHMLGVNPQAQLALKSLAHSLLQAPLSAA